MDKPSLTFEKSPDATFFKIEIKVVIEIFKL